MEKHNYKITGQQFLETLFEQNGKYTNTAKALQKKYGVMYTRQGVYKRAKCFKNEMNQVNERPENRNNAPLIKFATDEGNDIRLRIRIHTILANRACSIKLRQMKVATKFQLQTRAKELRELAKKDKSLPIQLTV